MSGIDFAHESIRVARRLFDLRGAIFLSTIELNKLNRGMRGKSESMFFVRGLTSNGKEVLVNPDQVLYVGPAGLRSAKTALILTHGKRLVVDQDIESVSRCFEDYLRDVIDTRASDDPETRILDDDPDPDEVLS